MVNKLNKDFYNTVLCQAFSPCGNYLVVGDIYGTLAVFYLTRIIQSDYQSSFNKDEQLPKNRITVKDGYPICSLLCLKSHLLVGGVGEIYSYTWKSMKSNKNPQISWVIEIANHKDGFEKTDVNCMLFNEDLGHIYVGCGDNKIYIFNIETRSLVKTLVDHKDYIHSIANINYDLISSGEDGVVNIWDLRTGKICNKITPWLNDKIARPEIGKWIGAVGCNEDYILCGGGPRLSLWHYRFLTNSTVFPISDGGIHVAEIYKDKILAGGRAKFFYHMTFVGEILTEIPTSAVTTYSTIHQDEPFTVLSLAGSSPKIDICSNFMYKNQVLSLC